MFSIDQNCHPLWDVPPKLSALAAAGHRPTHLVEDVDTAFSALGGKVDSHDLHLAPERYYRGGGADWGAAVFYFHFLGRQPLDLADLEPYTGLSTKATAKKLGLSVDELYDRYSPSDNWQLIGSSYVGDKDHHRLLGDLSVAEVEPFLKEVFSRGRADCRERFCRPDARKRTEAWFGQAEAKLADLLDRCAGGQLADLYARWLKEDLAASAAISTTSAVFAPGGDRQRRAVLELFTRDYDRLAGLYNDALAESDSELRPLDTKAGELPFFAAYTHNGHRVRSVAHLRDGRLVFGGRDVPLGPGGELPTDALAEAGVFALVGKAVVLVIQARLGEGDGGLALPYRGSLYMPAAHALTEKLLEAGLLPGPLKPLLRVRFRLLDRLGECDTDIALPEYLARTVGIENLPAAELAEAWSAWQQQGRATLEQLADDEQRQAWQREQFAETAEEIDRLDARRRQLAREDPKNPEVRDISHRVRELENDLVRRTLEAAVGAWHLREVDYFDSRGALEPWCLAAGGDGFYRRVIEAAEIYEEGPR